MDIQEKIRNEYSVVQDYEFGKASERSPIMPENTSKFPGQLEKPTAADLTLEAPDADDTDEGSAPEPVAA